MRTIPLKIHNVPMPSFLHDQNDLILQLLQVPLASDATLHKISPISYCAKFTPHSTLSCAVHLVWGFPFRKYAVYILELIGRSQLT